MKRKHKIVLTAAALLAVVLAAATVFVVRTESFQISYHTWQMKRARKAVYGDPDIEQDGMAGFTLGEYHERYEYHRQQLIELGVVRELRFRTERIELATEESSHFTKSLFTKAPQSIDWEGTYSEERKPMELTVWCYPADAEAWKQFIASRDIPDYEARFMTDKQK